MKDNIELKTAKRKSTFLKNLDFKQKTGLLTLLIAIASVPVALYLSSNQTRLGSKASSLTDPHSNNNILFSASPYVEGNPINTTLALNTKGEAIDGVQFVAYLNYSEAGLINIGETKFTTPNNSVHALKVVTNSITHDPLNSRYKLSLSAITSNPSQPFSTNDPIPFGAFLIATTKPFDQTASLSIEFDNSKTKMISHASGENLAVNQAPYQFTLYNPPTSIPATPVPTSTPTPTPTPTPSPTSNPTSTQFGGDFELEGYHASISSRIPRASFTLYNATTLKKVDLGPQIYGHDNERDVLIYSGTLNITVPTEYILVINAENHHQETARFQVTPYVSSTDNFSISSPILVGDITNDHVIDIEDYHQLAIQFDPVTIQESASADLNFDQRVDIDDYNYLSKNFDPEYSSHFNLNGPVEIIKPAPPTPELFSL